MKNINEIIASLNVARSNDCSKEKSEEFKSIIKELLPYGELEQELGIDLRVLFKALKNGIYDKCEDRKVLVYLTWHDYLKEIVLFYDDENPYYNGCYKLKDYGKTWALTKEELL